MPSPFPGMDPWLENRDCFPDVHDSLAIYLREELNTQMPEGYVARAKTRIYHESEHSEPDIAVRTSSPKSDAEHTALATLPGYEIFTRDTDETHEETYLEIRTSSHNRLVTGIEILSRSNKTQGGKGRKKYLHKQRLYIRNKVNLVEIDLLRFGTQTTRAPIELLKKNPDRIFQYHVCATIGTSPEFSHVAMIRLEDPLPKIGVPLDDNTKPVVIDLQKVLTKVYDHGRYTQSIDYHQPLDEELEPAQQRWASSVLKSHKNPRSDHP